MRKPCPARNRPTDGACLFQSFLFCGRGLRIQFALLDRSTDRAVAGGRLLQRPVSPPMARRKTAAAAGRRVKHLRLVTTTQAGRVLHERRIGRVKSVQHVDGRYDPCSAPWIPHRRLGDEWSARARRWYSLARHSHHGPAASRCRTIRPAGIIRAGSPPARASSAGAMRIIAGVSVPDVGPVGSGTRRGMQPSM